MICQLFSHGIHELVESMMSGLVLFFVVFSSFLMVAALLYNAGAIGETLRGVGGRAWAGLFVIFVLALALRLCPTHRHIIFMDEPALMEAGKSILVTHTAGGYPECIAWPYVIGILFAVFGISNHVVLYASSVFGALTVVPVFLAAYQLFNKRVVALAAAFLFALNPKNILWSTTAREDVFSQFMIMSTLFCFVLYFKNPRKRFLWLACITLCFMVQIKLENYIYPALFLAGVLIFRPVQGTRGLQRLITPLVFAAVVSLPNFTHVFSFMRSENWTKAGPQAIVEQHSTNWSLSNLASNTAAYGPKIFNTEFQPLFYALLIALGLFIMVVYNARQFSFLAIWFIFLTAIFFTSWFQAASGHTRLLMIFDGITVLFAACGVGFVYDKIADRFGSRVAAPGLMAGALIAALLFWPHIRALSQDSTHPDNILQTRVPEMAERDLPAQCVVVAARPQALTATTNIKAVSLERFMADREFSDALLKDNNCVLLYDDTFCRLWDKDLATVCANAFAAYTGEVIKTYNFAGAAFRFTRITGRAGGGSGEFKLIKTMPAQGAAVPRNPASFVFVFNGNPDPQSIRDDLSRAIQINGVSYRTNVSIENNTITLKPLCFDEFLDAQTQYTYVLTGALRNTEGVALSPAELVFHTGDEINPQGPHRGCTD